MKQLLNIILLVLLSQYGIAQQTIQKEYPSSQFENLVISSFNGNIIVRESKNDKLEVSVSSKRKKFPKGFSVEVLERDGYLAIFLRTPCTRLNEDIIFDKENPFDLYSIQDEETYNCHIDMDPFKDFPELKIKIALPTSVRLFASLINGDIDIQDSESEILVNNVMGNIQMKNVQHVSAAKTVNGNIDIEFKASPKTDVEFTTVNGDIDIAIANTSNLQARFKSFSGDLFTDFESTKIAKQKIAKTTEKDASIKLKLNEYTVVQIGKGGINFTMETIHGNAYLKAI